jgi:hypothetical protein
MAIIDGGPVDAAYTNSKLMSRTVDTSTTGRVDLLNALAASGASVSNVQRFVNAVASLLGITTSEAFDYLFTYTSNVRGAANDTVKERLDALTEAFILATGHNHNGTEGNGSVVSASNLSNFNNFIAEYQSISVTGASGLTSTITTQMTGKTPGGATTVAGVITSAPNNIAHIVDSSTGTFIEDAGGQKVYGRITESGGVWTLTHYTNEVGVETPHNLSSTNIKVIFLEVFTMGTRPTIPSNPLEFGTLDITADIADASVSQSGKVNIVAQTFNGLKTFDDGIATDTIAEKTAAAGVTIDGAQIKDGVFVPLNNVTNDAQLKRADGDFNTFTEKTTTVDNDIVLIEDSAASFAKKKVKMSNLGGGSGTGSKNYFTSSVAQGNSVTGFNLYKDAAGSLPVDGTGGTPTSGGVEITTSASSPLSGLNSIVISKDALASSLNLQGEGVSIDFTLDTSDKGKVLAFSFDYAITDIFGAGYADDDMIVYFYDVTNSALLQPTPFKIKKHTLTSDKFFCEVQTPYNCNSIRLIFHQTTTSTGAYSIKLDNLLFGPQAKLYGSVATDWVSFTPTGSWVTNSTYNGKFRRVGDVMEVSAQISLTGAPTSATLLINLPSGYSIDTSKLNSDLTRVALGMGMLVDAGTNTFHAMVRYNATTNVQINSYGVSGTYSDEQPVTQAVPYTFANGDLVTVNFRVPILGWSSSQLLSQDAATRKVSFSVNTSTTAASTTQPIIYTNVLENSHGSYDVATGRFTCKIPGTYFFEATGYFGGTTAYLTIYKNGSTFKQGTQTVAGAEAAVVSGSMPLIVGDIVDIRPNTSATASGGAVLNFFTGFMIQGPAQILANEEITEIRQNIAGTSIANSTWTAVPYATLITSSHGLLNSSGVFTASSSVVFDFMASVVFATNSTGMRGIRIRKNGNDTGFGALIFPVAANPTVPVISGAISLIAGDALTVECFQSSGGSLSLNTGTDVSSMFAVRRKGM